MPQQVATVLSPPAGGNILDDGQPKDDRPALPGVESVDLSAIRNHPNANRDCQVEADAALKQLKDQGINGRLVIATIKNPPKGLPLDQHGHVMVLYKDPDSGKPMMLDSRAGPEPGSPETFAHYYAWVAQEK